MSIDQKLNDEFEKQISDINKANLMVVGGTGVGKSSLINRVFGEELAKTGAGAPVTRGCNKYERDNIPVIIFDTEGYEIADGGIDNSNFQRSVISEIERRESLELKEQIHLYWYCISANNHRITEYDIANITALNQRHAKLAVVITQCDSEEIDENNEGLTSKSFREVLKTANINNDIFETSATLEDSLQLDALTEWSAINLPTEKLKDAFIGAQRNNLKLKDKQASKAILYASGAAAAAAGINPIPISDSLTIVPIQMALAARLAQIYGFDALGNSVLGLLKAQVVSLIGRQMAASLTKLIPILGQVINAGIAGGITSGLGHALKHTYRAAYIEVLETGTPPNWSNLFASIDILMYIKNHTNR